MKRKTKKLKNYKRWLFFYFSSWDSFVIHDGKSYQIDRDMATAILGDKVEIKKKRKPKKVKIEEDG